MIHSHYNSLATCFRRYFDSIYTLTLIFPRHGLGTTAAMGGSYLLEEVRYMMRAHPLSLPYYLLYNLAKIGGTFVAPVAERLPRRVVRAMSLHRYYWEH